MEQQTLTAIARTAKARIDSGAQAKFARFDTQAEANRFYHAAKTRGATIGIPPYIISENGRALTTVVFIPDAEPTLKPA